MLSGLSGTELDKLVSEVIPDIPAGHRTAIVGTLDAAGAQIVAFANLDESGSWKASFAVRHEWADGDTALGAKLMWSK